jgi:hypothetical protein
VLPGESCLHGTLNVQVDDAWDDTARGRGEAARGRRHIPRGEPNNTQSTTTTTTDNDLQNTAISLQKQFISTTAIALSQQPGRRLDGMKHGCRRELIQQQQVGRIGEQVPRLLRRQGVSDLLALLLARSQQTRHGESSQKSKQRGHARQSTGRVGADAVSSKRTCQLPYCSCPTHHDISSAY